MSVSSLFSIVADGHALAQAIVDTLREPLLVLDKRLNVIAASRAFYRTFKVEPHEVEGRAIYALGDGQWNIPDLRELLERILPRQTVMEAYEVEHDFAGVGWRTMLLNARVLDEGDANTLILLAFEDVTARRAAEGVAAELLKQKGVLLEEMQHRVANSLQIIASILLLKARSAQSEESRQHLHDAHRRVISVAAVQEQLHASGHGETIELEPYLRRLCETLAASMIGEGGPITLVVHAEGGTATSAKAVSIGLIVTELVINALKHAFLDGTTSGEIVIGYEVNGGDWRLTVSDNGVGMPAANEGKAKPGLGTSIVEALARQLEGRVAITRLAQGTAVSINHGVFGAALPAAA